MAPRLRTLDLSLRSTDIKYPNVEEHRQRYRRYLAQMESRRLEENQRAAELRRQEDDCQQKRLSETGQKFSALNGALERSEENEGAPHTSWWEPSFSDSEDKFPKFATRTDTLGLKDYQRPKQQLSAEARQELLDRACQALKAAEAEEAAGPRDSLDLSRAE